MDSGKQKIRWSYKRNAWCFRLPDPEHPSRCGYFFLIRCVHCGSQDWRGSHSRSCRACNATRQRELQAIRGPAHKAVASAVNAGFLPRLFPAHAYRDGRKPASLCVDCGSPAEIYEHRDYNRPLDVQPVCRSCNSRRGPAIDIAHLVTPRVRRDSFT